MTTILNADVLTTLINAATEWERILQATVLRTSATIEQKESLPDNEEEVLLRRTTSQLHDKCLADIETLRTSIKAAKDRTKFLKEVSVVGRETSESRDQVVVAFTAEQAEWLYDQLSGYQTIVGQEEKDKVVEILDLLDNSVADSDVFFTGTLWVIQEDKDEARVDD